MTKVYWCPKHENSTALILGSIQVQRDSSLSEAGYLEALAERVQRLVDAEPDPKAATRRVERALEEAGLMPGTPEDPEDAGQTLIASSPGLPDYLRAKGLLLRPPMQVRKPTPEARKAVEETTLDEWVEMIRPDRTLE